MLLVAALVVGGVVYWRLASTLPDPDAAAARGRDQSTVITDRNGKVLTRLFAEQNRSDVTLDQIPEELQKAVVATEDQRFYTHSGVDPLGIARAIVTDVILRRKAQGGSTITQQYVKQAFVGDERTITRKIKEAMLAQRVEKKYDKNQILELYLNTIYFGHGAYGVQSASRAYFGKPASKLTLPESAMIAGVIKSPGRYSPYIDPEAAKLRRDTVLQQMRSEGYIDEAAYAAAVASPVKTAGLKPTPSLAPYFVEWIKTDLAERFGQDEMYRGGLIVKTTLDLSMQKAAEKAIASTLNRNGDPSAALVAIKPGTGEVLAMVGGRDFKTQQFNAAVQGNGRQPGSSFKPFVLVTALSDGISPEQTYPSGAARLKVGDQTWSVTGAHGGAKGPMRLRIATEQSVNSVFARLILKVTPEKVVETAEGMGLHSGIEPVPAIALGGLTNGVTPLEMADAYSTLAANGSRVSPFGVTEVKTADGSVAYQAKPEAREAIEPAVAYLTTDILKGVIARGTGSAASIGRPAAGKTGTTQENRDAWFVGYTPDLAAAVWMGHPEAQKAMTNVHGRAVTGGSFPAEMWAKFMRTALAKTPATQFQKPSGLKRAKICLETGQAAREFCPRTGSGLFLASMNLKQCTKHVTPEKLIVPKLVGMTKEAALAALEKLKLAAKVIEKSVSGVDAGIVAEQTPAQGSVATSQTVVTITVSTGGASNEPPKAEFTLPATAASGEKVALDGTASTDDGTITTWYWEFGDGTTAKGSKVSHAWPSAGAYDVTLWVTDDSGQQGSVTKTIRVN
ncbi:MAG: PBP1A family penicillin-binding protein [Coriobacteriia bacterium]|nr:PBP1A family penicillin-binding protein [Coriobacteriia bacterium]